jgi:hypothetical protein
MNKLCISNKSPLWLVYIKSSRTHGRFYSNAYSQIKIKRAPRNRLEFLQHLSATSTSMRNQLHFLQWFEELPLNKRAHYIEIFQADRTLRFTRAKTALQNTGLVEYCHENLQELTTREKAIVFKLFSMLSTKSFDEPRLELVNRLLLRLEIDYYSEAIEKCDLVDFTNYSNGFAFFRASNSSLVFHSKSADLMYKNIVSAIESEKWPPKVDQGAPSESICEEAISEINKKWLINEELTVVNACHLLDQAVFISWGALTHFFSTFAKKEIFERVMSTETNCDEHVLSLGKLEKNPVILS